MDLLTDKGAIFNTKRTHRQSLWRIWDSSVPMLVCIGMNPSTADEEENDPTVERTERRARKLGYGGLIMLNMQDIIETDSTKLDDIPSEKRCTADNSTQLLDALDMASNGKADILCAWGKPGQKYGPVAWLATQAARRKVTLYCLKKNKDGSPQHPLYLPYEKMFEWFAGVDFKDAAKPWYERTDR